MIKNKWQDRVENRWRRREDGFEGCRFYWCNKKYIRHAPFLRYLKKMLKSLISSILSLSSGFLIALKIEKLEFKSYISVKSINEFNITNLFILFQYPFTTVSSISHFVGWWLGWWLGWLIGWSVGHNTNRKKKQ